MGEVVIRTPVPDYTGSVGAVVFTQGRAVADTEAHAAEIAYCQARGYFVGEASEVEAVEAVGDNAALPRKSASAADWREYAVANGMSADEAATMSRDQLVERFTISKGDEQ